jgi:hypothetical protein
MNIIDAKDFATDLEMSGLPAKFKPKAKFLTTGGYFVVKTYENRISQENGKKLFKPYGDKEIALEVEITGESKFNDNDLYYDIIIRDVGDNFKKISKFVSKIRKEPHSYFSIKKKFERLNDKIDDKMDSFIDSVVSKFKRTK